MSKLEVDGFGTKRYYNEKRLCHREDGPAVEYTNGNKYWFQNGICHREDGPAIEYYNGINRWYYYGKQMDCDSQEEFLKLIKLKAFW